MIRHRILSLALAGACVPMFVASGAAMAQLPKATEVPAGALAQSDSDFLQQANRGNVAQIMLARTAMKMKRVDSGVSALAESIVSSHTKAQSALKLLAGVKKVDLPGAPNASQKAEIDDLTLTGNKGADGNRLFVEDVVRDNDQLIALYEDAMNDSQDPDIRKHASIMLPALRENRLRAQDLLSKALK